MNRTPWQPGDPVASGVVYLPTSELRRQYHQAAHDAVIDGIARGIVNMPELQTRRAAIARVPEKWRDKVQARVKVLWGQK
jgi:hypothetical protein